MFIEISIKIPVKFIGAFIWKGMGSRIARQFDKEE